MLSGMNHLCIGCGICAAACPSELIRMDFRPAEGLFLPSQGMSNCPKSCGTCEKVCPFVPRNPSTVDLTRELFGGGAGMRHNDFLGHFLSASVGYSAEHRMKSASGGLATWMLESLISSGEVDAVICVRSDPHSPTLFNFAVCSTVESVHDCSGSCYQPVQLSAALRHVQQNDGRYAVVALPCVAKAIRLAMARDRRLKGRIRFILGLVCGQVKSRHFIDYLTEAKLGGVKPTAVNFRTKRSDRPASDYCYRFITSSSSGEPSTRDVGWSDTVGRVWADRWFTPEACDYCDDVFAECADAVFMDAWLPQYTPDWRGHSIMLIRSPDLERLAQSAAASGAVELDSIPVRAVLESQAGVVVQKRILAGCHARAASRATMLPAVRCMAHTRWDVVEAALMRRMRSALGRGPSPKGLAWAKGYAAVLKVFRRVRRRLDPQGARLVIE